MTKSSQSQVSKLVSLSKGALFVTLLPAVNVFAQQAATAPTTGPEQVAGSTAQQPGAPGWMNFILIGGIILFMWLFMFRPQAKRAKEQRAFLAALAPGMEVITQGGIVGTIVEVRDTIVSLNLGNSVVRVLKSSISGKLETPATVLTK